MRNTELELKLSLSKDELERFRRRPILRELAIDRPKRRKLRSIYFDTPDLRLHRAKMSLRVRKKGRRWLQTVKCKTQIQHGLSNPIEVENYVKRAEPDLERIGDEALKQQLIDLISDQPLRPAFETSIWRTTRNVEFPGAGTIELALDRGEIHAGGKTKDICEVELELKTGRPQALLRAAKALFAEDTITVSRQSKAERGYTLLNGAVRRNIRSPRPHKGRKPVLHARMSSPEALCEVGRAASDQILDNWRAVLATSDPEGAHQLRIGLRRLRTASRVLKSANLDTDMMRLAREARDMARIVGQLRDADVLLSDIYAPAAKEIFGKNCETPLRDVLKGHRERERISVRASLAGAQWSSLKLNCIFFEHAIARSTGSMSEIQGREIVSIARRALKKCWRRVRKWGCRLDKLSFHERHEMRKDLKSLRYATEFFLPLYSPKEAREFLKQLKRLQDVFGYLNDVAMAEQLSAIVDSAYPDRADLQQCVKTIHHWHQSRADLAWNDAQRRWKKLADTPRFWR